MVELSLETASLNQRQGDCLQDFSKQLPALFADLVLTLECAALPGFEIEAGRNASAYASCQNQRAGRFQQAVWQDSFQRLRLESAVGSKDHPVAAYPQLQPSVP